MRQMAPVHAASNGGKGGQDSSPDSCSSQSYSATLRLLKKKYILEKPLLCREEGWRGNTPDSDKYSIHKEEAISQWIHFIFGRVSRLEDGSEYSINCACGRGIWRVPS